MLIDKVLNKMMKNTKLRKEIKNNLGMFLKEVSKDFNTNLLYSKYLNFDDLIYLYENSKEELKDKNNMFTNFLQSEFVSDNEKDLLLDKLKDYEIDKKYFERYFGIEIPIKLKRKYFKDYFNEDDDFYKYAWGEELPIEWINSDLKDLNHKEKFYYLFSNHFIPSELIKLEYLEDIYKLKNDYSLNRNNFTEQENKIIKKQYFDSYFEIYLSKMPLEEKLKFLKLDFKEQEKFFESDIDKLIFYKHFIKKEKIRVDRKREEIFNGKEKISYKDFPLEIKLCLLEYSKKDLDIIVKNEIKQYFKKFPEDKIVKLKNSNVIFAISLSQDFDEELFFNYGTVLDAETMIYNKKNKDISLETIKKIILHYPKSRNVFDLAIWHKNFSNLSLDDEDFYYKNGYLNNENINNYVTHIKLKNEKILDTLYKKDFFSNNIFEYQVLSTEFLEKNKHLYNKDNDTTAKNYYFTRTNQENLPEKFINEIKEKDLELYLLNNFNYMYNKNVDKYKEKIIEMLPIKSKEFTGGNKFDFILSFIMIKLLQKNKLKVEYNNSGIELLKEKEYNKKYPQTITKSINNKIDNEYSLE
jgi:hypothetical protein